MEAMEAMKESLDYSNPKTYVALFTFLFCWLMFAFNWKSLPVGRTASALLGGSIMVTFQVITSIEAFSSISGGTMLLLIGLMVILAKLEEKGITGPLKKLLLIGNPNPKIFLARVSFCSAFLGATIMNDGAAIFLTSVVMDIVEEYGLLAEPFALAVATSANIGSAATVLGNPKNMLVQEKVPGLDFLTFSRKMLPPALLCTILNTIFLVIYYWKDLDNLPLIPVDDKKQIDILGDEEQDDDVLRMEREYLANKSKFVNLDEDDYPPLAYLPNEITPIKNQNSPSFCDQITETPRNYNTLSTFDSYKSTSKFFNVNEQDKNSDRESIMSPALSFSDLDELELNNIPKYKWPKQAKFNEQLETIQSYFSYPNSTIHPNDIIPNTLRQISINRNIELTKYQKSIHFFKNNIRNVLIGITLFIMYSGFILKWDLGWTCLTASMVLLFIDGKDASGIINEHINWSLLSYLFGIFSLLCGVGKTPLPKQVWNKFSPLINPTTPNLMLSTISFSVLVIILSFIFTSIPTVLLVSPYLPDLQDEQFKKNIWFLLAWSVTLCGNLTAFGSVAGLIVSEICKDYCIEDESQINNNDKLRRKRPNQWVGEFNVWTGFTWWSTTILLLVGAFYIML